MTLEHKPKLTLEEQVAADIAWEETTKLKGWQKTLAFFERVLGDTSKEHDKEKEN